MQGVAERLRQLGYQVVTADASSGVEGHVLGQMEEGIVRNEHPVNAQVQSWTYGYASSLDGFDDALRDLKASATVFVFPHFDQLQTSDPRAATAIVDSLVRAAWWHVLQGRLVLGLVHRVEALGTRATFSETQWWGWSNSADV